MHGVSGKGGYGWTRIWTQTRRISKYTFTFIQHLFFVPNIVFTAVFASKPCVDLYPFISTGAKDRLSALECQRP